MGFSQQKGFVVRFLLS